VLCDDLGLRTAILAWPPTLDESDVAVRQTGGRDPHHGIQILGVPAGGSQPAGAGSRVPPAAPSPLDKGKGAASSSFAPGGTRGQRRIGDAGYVAPMGRSSRTLLLMRTRPKSIKGQLAGPRGPAPRLRARRGASVLRHHRIRRRRHHHHRSRHHHLGVISPRGANNNSSSSNSSGRPASRAAGRSRAPSKCSPILVFASLVIMPTGLNPSLFARASSPSAPKGAPTPSGTMLAGGSGSQQQASAGSGAGGPPPTGATTPTATSASTTATLSSTPSAAVEEVPAAPIPAMRGDAGARPALPRRPLWRSWRWFLGGGSDLAPSQKRHRFPSPGVVSCALGPSRD
jgi:hypothetical protein